MKRVIFILLIFSFLFLHLNAQYQYYEDVAYLEGYNFQLAIYESFFKYLDEGLKEGTINDNTKILKYNFIYTFISPQYKNIFIPMMLEYGVEDLYGIPIEIVRYENIDYNKTKFFIKVDIEKYERMEREAKEKKEKMEREARERAKEKEKEGENYYNIGEYDKAISSLSESVSLNTNSQKAYFLLGKSYFYNERYDDAEDSLYKALEFNTNDTAILYYIGKVHYYKENYNESIDIFNKINKSDPKNTEVLYILAVSYYNSGNKNQAINNFLKYIEIDKNNDNVYYLLGKSYYDIGNIEKAEEAYSIGLELNSQNANILYALGELHSSIGNKKEAKEYYQKSLEADPNHNLSKTKLDSIIMEENIKIRNEKIQELNRSLNTAKIFKTTGIVLMVGGALTTASPFVIQYINTKNMNSMNFDFLNSSKTDKDSKLQRTLFYTGVGVFGAGLITTIISSFAINNLEKQISYAFVPIINKNEYGIMDYGYAFNFSYKF